MALARLLDEAARGEGVTPKSKRRARAQEVPLFVDPVYFQRQGVGLLPEDAAHLRRWLPLSPPERNETISGYIAVWLNAMNQEPVPHKKANTGRRAANIWLRGNG